MGKLLSYPQQQQQQQPFVAAADGEPPLWAPYYGAPFAVAVKRFFKKYATFSGRASRSEYWWWALVNGVVTLVLTGGTLLSEGGSQSVVGMLVSPVLILWALATIVPSLALTVRRLHDSNKSGWMYLLGLIPIVGGIIVLVFVILPAEPAGQQYDRPAGY